MFWQTKNFFVTSIQFVACVLRENLSNQTSGVQIPRDICTLFGRYLYSTKCSWIMKRHYFVLSAVLFILQYFWLYFAISCSAMKKNLSEKVLAWTYLVTDVIFIWWRFYYDGDISSNCRYFLYEPAPSRWICLAKWKVAAYREIWALRSKRKAILHETLPNGHPSKY